MTIREFAKEHNHVIIGRLQLRENGLKYLMYVDDVGNEYFKSKKTGDVCIVTVDGDVI